MVFAALFETLFNFPQPLDALRASSWLESTPSGGGPYPPLNVFRKGDDFVIITEIPGVRASDLDIQVRGNAIRIAGIKTVDYSDKASRHRREGRAGTFDRHVNIPVEVA